jgi:hypothetical protein
MALRIFETDPDAKPKRISFDDGTVGKIHSGKMVGKAPVSLDHWEFSTGDADVSNALAELFHAPVIDTGSDAENFLRIEDTGTDTVEIILAGPSAVQADMKQWINGKLFHHCDGVVYLSAPPDNSAEAGDVCGCPRLFKDRKDAAKSMRGPSPSIKILFRLAADPDLGLFAFATSSWTLAEVLYQYEDALESIAGPAVADLKLELVEYTTKQGRNVSYRKPVLERIRAYDDANAE